MRVDLLAVLLGALAAAPAAATTTATIASSSTVALEEPDELEPEAEEEEVKVSELPLLDAAPADERSGLLPPLTPPALGARADVLDPDEPLEIGNSYAALTLPWKSNANGGASLSFTPVARAEAASVFHFESSSAALA